MNILMQKLFENRGYPDDYYERISFCNHDLPARTDELCARLHDAYLNHRRVTLLTDIDMDGLMSGTLGFAGLAELGFSVSLFCPDANGYGFGVDAIDDLMTQYPDTGVILTADVGISEYRGISYAAKKAEVLVTDHHKPSGEAVPASVIVDPQLPSGINDYPDSCGAAVLFYALRRYAQLYAPQLVPQIERLVVFAGIGTVSDQMPVWFENRTLISDAAAVCRMVYSGGRPETVNILPGCSAYRNAFIGFFAVLEAFAEAGKLRGTDSIDESFFGFYLAPTFNSIKRIGSSEDIGVDAAYNIFFGGYDKACESIRTIMELNDKRKEMVDQYFAGLAAVKQPWAPYAYITDAPGGLRGLLAQRVMSETGVPAFVVGRLGSSYVGSGRSPAWFPIIDSGFNELRGCSARGHNSAFGVTFNDEGALDEMSAWIGKLSKELRPKDISVGYDFVIASGGQADALPSDIPLFMDFLDELNFYRPFGRGFEEPKALLRFPSEQAVWSLIGKDRNHVRITLNGGLTCLCFNQGAIFGDRVDVKSLPPVIEVEGKLSLNEWNGNVTVQFVGNFVSDMTGVNPVYMDIFDATGDAEA